MLTIALIFPRVLLQTLQISLRRIRRLHIPQHPIIPARIKDRHPDLPPPQLPRAIDQQKRRGEPIRRAQQRLPLLGVDPERQPGPADGAAGGAMPVEDVDHDAHRVGVGDGVVQDVAQADGEEGDGVPARPHEVREAVERGNAGGDGRGGEGLL